MDNMGRHAAHSDGPRAYFNRTIVWRCPSSLQPTQLASFAALQRVQQSPCGTTTGPVSMSGSRQMSRKRASTDHERIQEANKAQGRAVTAFEERLYEACSAIPRGKVAAYGTLASVLKSSARAVGQGMRRNPFAPRVPCHRVIAANRTLGGFRGSKGDGTKDVCDKKAMLQEEGVTMSGNQVDGACMLSITDLQQCLKKPGLEQVP
ncbi:6-O-methylguanine DNA methyltransferase [Haematococcus lacustris]